MQGGVGGKLHVFLSCLPKVGARALTVRDSGARVNDKEPLKSMLPASTDYRRMAEGAAESMVSSPIIHLRLPPASGAYLSLHIARTPLISLNCRSRFKFD